MLVESNAVAGTVREIGELILAPLERLLAEIEAVELDQVEGAEQSGMVETANADNIPKFAMALGSLGNVRTRTVRAWPEAEMSSKPAKRPKLLAAIQICKRSWPSFFGNVRPSPANWQ